MDVFGFITIIIEPGGGVGGGVSLFHRMVTTESLVHPFLDRNFFFSGAVTGQS